jgi:hypothetical protein
MPKSRIPRVARGAALTLAITAVGCTLSAPASAETTIGAFKGVPTLDGLSTSSVYSYDDTPGVATRTEVVRAGVPVDQSAATFDLVTGDTIQVLDAATGALITQAPFLALPALGASTCVGSAALNGLRNPGGSVDGVYAYKRGVAVAYPDGSGSYRAQEEMIRGSVLMTAGVGFAGAFRKVLPAGHVVRASQSLLLSDTVNYEVTVERLVEACPPPPAPAPAPDVTGPSGKLTLPTFLRESLLRSKRGMTVTADVSEAAGVRVDVYADNGADQPELVRLAGGKANTATAAPVKIKLKATRLGRKAMKGKRRVKAIVVATLTDQAGNVARLKMKKITIR